MILPKKMPSLELSRPVVLYPVVVVAVDDLFDEILLQKLVGETEFDGAGIVEAFHLRRGKLELQAAEVVLQLLQGPGAEYRYNLRVFLSHPVDGHL